MTGGSQRGQQACSSLNTLSTAPPNWKNMYSSLLHEWVHEEREKSWVDEEMSRPAYRGSAQWVREDCEEVRRRQTCSTDKYNQGGHQVVFREHKQSKTLTPPTVWNEQSAFFQSPPSSHACTRKCWQFSPLTSCVNRKSEFKQKTDHCNLQSQSSKNIKPYFYSEHW